MFQTPLEGLSIGSCKCVCARVWQGTQVCQIALSLPDSASIRSDFTNPVLELLIMVEPGLGIGGNAAIHVHDPINKTHKNSVTPDEKGNCQ